CVALEDPNMMFDQRKIDNVLIGIPILNRLDLLAKCLDAIDYPADVVVVNNNSIDPDFARELSRMAEQRRFTVLHQKRNLGDAASWNLIIRFAFDKGLDWVFVGSNDTFLHPGSLRTAVEIAKEPDVAVWYLHGPNFFLINKQTVETVGWFDENFFPAYKEDQDYSYRCHLAAMRQVAVQGASADHVGSATIGSNPDYAAQNTHTHMNWNRSHYIMKWGGDTGQEKFAHPYNDPKNDLKWWPDPGNSINERDWDNIYRRSLRDLYDRAASTPSDIWEHVPILYKFASTVRHVTEFGTGSGTSTSAFLFGRPDRLITYDVARHFRVTELETAARAAGIAFRFVEADVRQLR